MTQTRSQSASPTILVTGLSSKIARRLMIKHLPLLAVALILPLMASTQATKQIEAKPPTCTQPVGKWQNERKSVLEIKTYDAATGAISVSTPPPRVLLVLIRWWAG